MYRQVKVAGLIIAGCLASSHADADGKAMALATLVAERPANEGRVATMHFKLENKSGKVRRRTALMVHSEAPAVERIAIFFNKPAMIADTAFLSYNHAARQDENWLFLPATDRVRRLPVSERGDYFMGTDLTFGDVKDNFKFDLADWSFSHGGTEVFKGERHDVLVGAAQSAAIAREMGYKGFRAFIDAKTAFPIWVEYTDVDGEPLKRVEVHEIKVVGAAQTAMRFTAENLQTGHRTEVRFTDMRYVPDLDESILAPDALAYGAPNPG